MNIVFEKLESLNIMPHGGAKHLALRDEGDFWFPKPERFLATQSDVEHLQNLYDLRFPPIYVEFLLHFGLSYFQGWVSYPVPKGWDEQTDYAPTDVRVLYGINKPQDFQEHSTWDLGSEIRSARVDALPTHFLPIGESDGLPTVIYISCHEQDYGHIYVLTRKQIWDTMNAEEMCEKAFHIANSFEEFVQLLYIVPT